MLNNPYFRCHMIPISHNLFVRPIFFLLTLCLSFLTNCAQQPSAQSDAGHPDSFTPENIMEHSSAPDSIELEYLLGTFDQSEDSNFVKMKDTHTGGSAKGAYLQKEAYEAFIQMYEAAKAAGVSLTILSATRNFDYQKGIWERKWTGTTKVGGKNLATAVPDPEERARTILRYSSMPGTSRHHWGTDIDLNAFENSYFASGKGLKEYTWLQENASKYGFCQPYTAKSEDRPNGYEEERWHWSYMPIAGKYLTAYGHQVSLDMITGFKGSEVATGLNVIKNYVFGVACKD